MEFSRQEYWNELSFPSPEDLPNPAMEPVYLMAPALAGRFFITSTTWEAQYARYFQKTKQTNKKKSLQLATLIYTQILN